MANNLGMVFVNRIERNPSPISPSAEPAASLDEFSFGFEGLGDEFCRLLCWPDNAHGGTTTRDSQTQLS